MNRPAVVGGVAAVFILFAAFARAADAPLPSYKPVPGVSGTLNSVGSDTLNNLMTYWAEAFQKVYPNVKIQVEGKGSATAPPALTKGTAQLGPMSRAMKQEEEEEFKKAHGYPPTQYSVALDCLAVFVHKDNPVKGLTFDQLDSIFSKTRARGYSPVTNWGQLGAKGDWATQALKLYGRNPASGTYLYFKEHVLKKGDYLDTVAQQPGSAGVVEAVASNRYAIGYSGIGYKNSGVRAVPLAETADDELAQPTFENALNGTYPLGRTLYLYVNQKPNEPPSLLVKEFLKFVLSKEGQEIVVKDGFGSLPARPVEKQLELLTERRAEK